MDARAKARWTVARRGVIEDGQPRELTGPKAGMTWEPVHAGYFLGPWV
jgi:hypothetical protein